MEGPTRRLSVASTDRLSDIKRTVPITFEDDEGTVEIRITYRLSAMNIQLSDWLKDHGDDRGAIMGWLERLIVKWDITDGDKAVPATAEVMERYGFATPLLRLMLDALYEDASSPNLRGSYASLSLGPVPPRSGTR
jgi:hypothetical protein